MHTNPYHLTPASRALILLRSMQIRSRLARLREQGIKLRDATSFGLPGAVRLGVLAPAAQDALAQAWTSIRH